MMAATVTSADGSYELYCPIDRGIMIVGAQAEGRVRMFFQDTFDPDEAVEFQLSWEEEVGGVSFSLEPAGTISGTVYDANTSAQLTGCLVQAVNESTGVGFKTAVDENGTYTIDNLPFGNYIIMAMGMPDNPVTSNYAMEWWQETASHDTDGTPLMTTRSNGWEGYKFNGVPSGDYKISACFIDPQGHSNTQRIFYNNLTSLENADLVTVTAPSIMSGIDFTLPQANGQISGLVIYSGTLQSGDYQQVVIAARPFGQDSSDEVGYGASMSEPGTYQMFNIADGSYVVIAFLDIDGDMTPDSGEPYGFYGDPTPVTLTSTPENPYPTAAGTTIIITDEPKGMIVGHVSVEGQEDHSGATITAGSHQTTTTADGSYILNVTPGSYTVTIAKDGYLSAVSSDVYVVEILNGEPTEMPEALLLQGDVDASGASLTHHPNYGNRVRLPPSMWWLRMQTASLVASST